METIQISSGEQVLILWSADTPPEQLKTAVEMLSSKTGPNGKVQVEHIDRLHLSNHQEGSFDIAVSGIIQPSRTVHTTDVLAELARILKPGAALVVQEPVSTTQNGSLRSAEKVCSALKLSGLIDIKQPSNIELTPDDKEKLNTLLKTDSVEVVRIEACKPNYAVGASSQLKLSFAAPKSVTPPVDNNAASVWTLSANDVLDDDVELLDSDELLDEDDLKKPDPASLRVTCGDATKKKEKSTDCTCGLAEELDAEAQSKKPQQKAASSACGNCYLGDAFRCASCPYLGMPAYKPGEKIQLSQRQLTADQ